jgi:hypothetical protein
MFTIVVVLIIALAAALLFHALTQRTVRRALRCPVLGTDALQYPVADAAEIRLVPP